MPFYLDAYPIATVSSALFYALLIVLAFPRSRALVAPLLAHPVPPHQQMLQAFDAFRGLAAVMVALGHIWWATYPVFAPAQLTAPFLQYATKSVLIFAVLSGFLIYRSTLSIRTIGDLKAYIVRRFFRIYPVYLVSVLLAVSYGQYISGPHYTGLSFFVSDLFMLHVFDWPIQVFGNPATWSLYVEVAFYAFLPLTVVAVGRQHMMVFAIIGIVGLIIADCPSRVFGLWKFFLMGILASELASREYFRKLPIGLAAFAAGTAIVIYDWGGPNHDWVARLRIVNRHDDYETIGLGIGCVLMLAAVPHLPQVSRILNILLLRLVGLISYSVYLIHFFYIRANFPEITSFSNLGSQSSYEHFKSLPQMPNWYLPFVFFPGVLTWALICFLLVERPGMRLGRMLVQRASVPKEIMQAQPAE